MENVAASFVDSPFSRQRDAAAHLLAQSEAARQKALEYVRCFAQLEDFISTLNGAKRHGFRMQLRALEDQFQAAVDELTVLELQLARIHQGLSPEGAVIQDDLSAAPVRQTGLTG